MLAFVIMAGGVVAAITFLNPRVGCYVFWFLWMCYPTSLLYGIMPLNARFDDLFLVFLTLCCIRVAPPDVLTSRSFRIAVLWFSALFLGNLVGVLTSPDYVLIPAIRELGKDAYCPMLVYVLNTVVRDARDVRRQILAIGLAIAGTSTIGVVQLYRPELTAIWEIPSVDPERKALSESAGIESENETRRAGSSVGLGPLAVIGGSAILLGLRLAVHASSASMRLGCVGMAAAGAMALGSTVSRGSAAGLAAALFYGWLRYSKRALTIGIVGVVGVIVLTQTDFGTRWLNRVGSQAKDEVGESVDVRTSLWRIYIQEWSPHYVLFGRGFTAEFVRHQGIAAHNTYVGAFAYTGLYGFVILAWMVVKVLRLAGRAARIENNPFSRGLGEALAMMTISLIVHGVSSELFQQSEPLWFGVVALVDWCLRAHDRGEGDMAGLSAGPPPASPLARPWPSGPRPFAPGPILTMRGSAPPPPRPGATPR